MAERKYYWIKLKKDFMNSDAVDFLMSQKNGAEYVVLYQMLCLMTVKTNGKLERQLNEVIIPYDAEKIQRDTKYFNIDTVRNALQLYIHLGLIYKDDNGCLSIADYENLVGVESGSAERMRRLRNLKASQCDGLSDANVTKLLQKSDELSDTDIDIDKEIDIDTDKEVINTNISCNLEVYKNGSYTAKNNTGIPAGIPTVSTGKVRLGKDSIGKDINNISCDENSERLPNGCQMVAERLPQVSIGKVSIDKNNKNNISCNGNSGIEVLDQKEMWFESFWEIYPKHQDKKKAKQKFLKLCTNEKEYKAIMDGLRNVLPVWAKKDTKYIPMPTTWLNGERWNDEVNVNLYELPF
nr:MAG TPA: Replication initiation and membrane attachment [Caudoviricetes sp.]